MNLTMTSSILWILFFCLVVVSESSMENPLPEEGPGKSVWTPCRVDDGKTISYRFRTCDDYDNPRQDQDHEDCSGTLLEVASRVCDPACETVTIQRVLEEEGHFQAYDGEDENVAQCLQMAAEQSMIQQESRISVRNIRIQNQDDTTSIQSLTKRNRNTTVSYQEFITGMLSLLNPVQKHRSSTEERKVLKQINMLLPPLKQNAPVPQHISEGIGNYATRYSTGSQLGGLLRALNKPRNPPVTPQPRSPSAVDMVAPNPSGGPPLLQRRRRRRDVDSIVTSPVELHVKVNGSIFHRVGELLRQRGQQIRGVFLRGMDTDFVGHLKRIGLAIRHFLSNRWNNFVETALPDRTTDANATDPNTDKSQQQHSILDRLMGLLDIRNGFSDESGKSQASANGNNKKTNSLLPDHPDDAFDIPTTSETTSQNDRNSLPFLSKPSDMVPNAIGNRKQSPSQNDSKVALKKDDSSLSPPEPPLNFSVVPELRKRVKREEILVSSPAGPVANDSQPDPESLLIGLEFIHSAAPNFTLNSSEILFHRYLPKLDRLAKYVKEHSTDTYITADLNNMISKIDYLANEIVTRDKVGDIFGFLQQLHEFQKETLHLSHYREVLWNIALFPKVQQLNHLRKVLNDLVSFYQNTFVTFLTKLLGDVSLHLLQFAEQLRNLAFSTHNLQHPNVLRSAKKMREVIRTKIIGYPRMMSRQRKVLKDIAFLITQVKNTRDGRIFYEKLLELSKIIGNRLMEFLHDLTDLHSSGDIPWYRDLLDDLITPLQHQYKHHDLPTFVDRLFGSYQDIMQQIPDSGVVPDTLTVSLDPEETINSTNDNLIEANTYQAEMLHSLKRRQIPPQHSNIRNFAFLNSLLDLSAGGKHKGNAAISELNMTRITEHLKTILANSTIISDITNMLKYIFEDNYDQSVGESDKLNLLYALQIMMKCQSGLNDKSSTVWNEYGASLSQIIAEAASKRFANTGDFDELLRILFHRKSLRNITQQSDQHADIIGLLGTHGDEQLANGIRQDLEIMNEWSSQVQSNFSAVEALTKFLLELQALQSGALSQQGTYPHMTMSYVDLLLHITQSNPTFDQGIANLQFLTKLIQDSQGPHNKGKFPALAKFLKDLQMTPSLGPLDLYLANISYVDFLQLLDDGEFSAAEISAMQDLANVTNDLNNVNISNDFSNLVKLFNMLKSTIEKEANELQSYSLLDIFSNMRGSYNTIADIKGLRRMLSFNQHLNAPVNDTVVKEMRNMMDSISSSHSLIIIKLFNFLRDAVRRGYYSTSTDLGMLQELSTLASKSKTNLTTKDVVSYENLLKDFYNIGSDQKYLAKDEDEALVQFLKSALGKDDWDAVKFIRLSHFADLPRNVSTATNTSEIQRLMMDIWAESLQHEHRGRRYLELLSDMRSNRNIFSEEDLEELNQIVKTQTDSFRQHGPYALHNLLGITDGSKDEQFISLIRLLTSQQFLESFKSNDILQMQKLGNVIRILLPNLTDEVVAEIMKLYTYDGSRDERFMSLNRLLTSQHFQDSFKSNDILQMRNLGNIMRKLLPNLKDEGVAEIMRLYTYYIGSGQKYLAKDENEALVHFLISALVKEDWDAVKFIRLSQFADEGGDILHFISTLSNDPYRPTWPWSNSALHKMKLSSLNDEPPKGLEGDVLSKIAGIVGQSHTGPHKPLMSLPDDMKDAADYKPSSIDVVFELDSHKKIKHWMKESTTALRSYLESINDVLASGAQNNAASSLDLIVQADIDMEAAKYSQAILDLWNLSRIVPNPVQTARPATSIYEDVLKLFLPGVPHTSLLAFVDALQEMFKQPFIDVSTDPVTLNKIGANLGSVPLAMTTTLDDIHDILIKTEEARSYLDYMQEMLSSISGRETDMLSEFKSLQDLESNGLLALLRTSSSSLVDKATLEHLNKLLGQKNAQGMFLAGWEDVLQDDVMRNDINFYETTALLNNYQRDIFNGVAFKQYFGDLSNIVDVLDQYSTLKKSIQKPGSNILDLLVDLQELPNETFNGNLFQEMHTLQENMTGFGSNLENTIKLLVSIFDLSPPDINAKEVLPDVFTAIATHSENITEEESMLLYRQIADNFQQPFKNAFADYLGNVSSLLWAKPEAESNGILLDMIESLDWKTISEAHSALLYQQIANEFEEPLEPALVELLGNISLLLWANPESDTDELLLDMLQGMDWITINSHEMRVLHNIFDEMRENHISWNEAKQNASEILRMFTTLLIPSSNEITEQDKSNLFDLLQGIAHVSDEVSRNDKVPLYKLIHDDFREFPSNFSRATSEKFLSFLDTVTRDKLSDKLFLQLVDRLAVVRNDSHQMKLVKHLFHDMVSRVTWRYNQTMSSIIKDLLFLHEKRRISPVIDFILKIVRSNDTDIWSEQDNMRMFEDMMRHISWNEAKQNATETIRMFTTLFIPSSNEITEQDESNLFDLLQGIAHVSDEVSRNDTVPLYKLIHDDFREFPSNFSRATSEKFLSFLDTATRDKLSDKLFLQLVDRLAVVRNDSHQMKLVKHLFHDMVPRVTWRYNQTMSSIIKDLLFLHEKRRISPVVDFILKIVRSNDTDIGSEQDNMRMFEDMMRHIPKGISRLKNFSRETMQQLFSLLTITPQENPNNKMFLQLVDGLIALRNDSQQRKIVHHLFQDMMSRVSLSYNETMLKIVEDILRLHKKRRMFPMLDLIQRVLATNETEIGNEEDNIKIYDAMNRRFPMKFSFQGFMRYLDNIQHFVDSGNKPYDLPGAFEKIFPVNENASRNDTLGLYRRITGAFHVPKFSRGPIEELISLLRNASKIQSHERILTSKAEDMLFLRFVDKLRIGINASHQRSLLRHTFNDMVSRVSIRYNRTISSILEDILLLHQNERMSPVVDFFQNIVPSNESQIGDKQANLKMFEDISRKVPTRFQLPDFTQFLKDLQYFGEFRNEPRAPESEDSILVSFLQNASYVRYLKPSQSKWVDYFHLIANTSVSETEDVIKTFGRLLKQSHKSTVFLTIDEGTELINILKNITRGQWMYRDDSSWRRIYGSLKNASSASEGKHLNELIKYLFGEVLNETKVDLSDGILLDMMEGVRNESLFSSDRVLHWAEIFRAIKKISLGQLRNTLGSLLEIMSRLDAVLEQPQPFPISDEEILSVFQNITELSITLQKSVSINSFNEMMHRMKQTDDELYPAVVKGNRRFLLQLDSLFNPGEFERKKREHVLLEFLLKIPRLLNASELDDGDLMALQQVNDLDYFDYSIYEERPLEDNRDKDALIDGFLGAMEKLFGVDLNVWNNSFPHFLGESPSSSLHGTSDLQRMYYSLAKGIRMMSKAFHGILTMLQTQSPTAEEGPTTTTPETNDLDAFLKNIGNVSPLETEPLTLIERFSKLTISVKNSTGSDLEDVIGVLSSLFAPQQTTDSIEQWSEWTAWSTCSTSCGHGEHVRRRTCSISIEGLLIASDQCIGMTEEVSGCLAECHEGSWTEWSSWSRCDNKCGVGNQTRSRLCGSNHMETIVTPPVNHLCNGFSDEMKACREYDFDECSLHEIFVPGTWSEWSAWTNCPEVCKGHRERQRSCHSLNETMLTGTRMKRDEGLLCEGDPKQNVSCAYSTWCWKRMHPLITDAWTEWSKWAPCDNRCGVGNQTRSRRCRLKNQNETMATHHHHCYGGSEEKRSCREYDFDECTLHNIFVSGTWTEWSQWSTCSENCTGHRNRHRLCHPLNEQTSTVPRMKRDEGLLCEGNSTQNVSCAYSTECWKRMHPVITAVLTEWSPWSQCDNKCGIGNQTRSRRCRLTTQRETMATLHRNHSCHHGSEEKRSCTKYDFDECTLHHIFVPGTWTEWGQWSICSDKCTGYRNRHRVCHPLNEQTSAMTRMKRDKGLLCEGNSTQHDSCVSSDCEHSPDTTAITVEQGTSAPVIVSLSMIGFVLFVILIIWYFATSRRRRLKKPYRTDRGNSAPSVFQSNGKRPSSEGSRSSSTRSILSWRSSSKESALFSDQNSEESARLLDNEEAPPVPSRFCPYRERSRSSTGDISAEWLWPWETEGDDWAGLDCEADNASQVNFDVYMEVDESAEEPQTLNDVPERVPSASDKRTEDDQDNKMVELEKSAEAWFD